MSLVFQGNQRQLRFTGEAKAFTPKDDLNATGANGNVALGKPRVRRNTAPPPPSVPPPSRPEGTHATQPSARSQRNTNTPVSYPPAAPSFREREHDDYADEVEDQQATMALDREREGIDLLPHAHARPSNRPASLAPAPIPHFRPANAAVATVLVPNAQPEPKKGAPLALWLFAAVLAGVLSYYVTPMAMSHFESPPPKVVSER